MVSLKTNNEPFYEHVFMPAVKNLPAEESHKLAVLGFRFKLFGQGKPTEPDNLVILKMCPEISFILILTIF